MTRDDRDCFVIVEGTRYTKNVTLERAQEIALECIAEQYLNGMPIQRWDLSPDTGEWSCRAAPITDALKQPTNDR
jgi:hypothetical protein